MRKNEFLSGSLIVHKLFFMTITHTFGRPFRLFSQFDREIGHLNRHTLNQSSGWVFLNRRNRVLIECLMVHDCKAQNPTLWLRSSPFVPFLSRKIHFIHWKKLAEKSQKKTAHTNSILNPLNRIIFYLLIPSND